MKKKIFVTLIIIELLANMILPCVANIGSILFATTIKEIGQDIKFRITDSMVATLSPKGVLKYERNRCNKSK